MNPETIPDNLKHELDDEDRFTILEIFSEKIVPKLSKLDARIGTLCCDFAGDSYRNWTLRFTSKGAGFEIVDFEYDEDATGISLDP